MTERYTWGGDGRDRMDCSGLMTDTESPTMTEIIRAVNQATVSAITATWNSVKTNLHWPYLTTLDRAALREHRRHCNLCSTTPGYPAPLRVDGADYRRRRNNRRKRTR